MFVDRLYDVGMLDAGINGLVTDRALLEAMANTANRHGALIGQGSGDRGKGFDLAWIIINWKLEVYDRVPVCGSFKVRTWAREYNRAFTYRDYEAYAEDGRLLARATSLWMLYDPAKKTLARITPEIIEPYVLEKEPVALPGYTFAKVNDFPQGDCVKTMDYYVPRSMIDCNGHVHNTNYLDFALEILGKDIQYDSVEIIFKKQIFPGETVRIEYAPADGQDRVYVRSIEDVSLHALIVMENRSDKA